MGVRVGIDLGTTYSAVARLDPKTGKPVVVPNSLGDSTTASAVAFQPDGTVLFGEEAKDEFFVGSPNAAALYKRDMGNESFQRAILGRTYTATDLSAVFLRHLVADAESVMGEKITGAVITVPAYFKHQQVQATIAAAQQAGLSVLATIHEPTAAALAYGLGKVDCQRIVMFYDLGGGTFDVTVARVSREGIHVLGSDGDHRLGGKDWDDAIARYLIDQLLEQEQIDISGDEVSREFVLGRAEQLKRHLTARRSVTLPIVVAGQRVSASMTRSDFETVTRGLLDRTMDIIEALLYDVGLEWADIDRIILVGGSTKMPMIRSFLEQKSRTTIETAVNPDEAVALGAAIRANTETDANGAMVLRIGNTPSTPTTVAGLLTPGIGYRISEVVPHALGMIAVNTVGDGYVNSIILPKNSTIPAHQTRSHSFKASVRNTEMEIFVLQGDYPRPLDNTIVNKYVAADIRPSDSERVEVTYSYDADGLVVVSATQDGRTLPVRIDKVPEDMSWADRAPAALWTGQVVLAVDLSGSMSGAPLATAKTAMSEQFVDVLGDSGVQLGVLLFADGTSWLQRPTDDHRRLSAEISGITIGQDGVGYGNDTHPFDSVAMLEQDDYLIVLTDGVWCDQPRAIQRAKQLHQRGVKVVALGFGGADLSFLQSIASEKDLAGFTDLSGLGDSFGKIAQVVQSGSLALR